MTLAFWKLSGAGNDFVIINNMDGCSAPAEPARRAEMVRRVCARRVGVGADGLILTESSARGAFRMRYYNADGGEADTCGNGARCVARFAFLQGIAPQSMRFETNAGVYEAVVGPESVSVSMSDAHSLETDIALRVEGLFEGSVDFVNTGVPHVVVVAADIERVPVFDLGRAIRYHPRFAPAGVNANFIALGAGANRLVIRTYERGVENETLACGTGSIASAIVAVRKGMVRPPVRLSTRSGADLVVHLEPTPDGARHVRLEGEARVVYKGELAELGGW